MMTMRLLICVLLLSLAGCSGGGGGAPSVPQEPGVPSGQLDVSFGVNGRVADAGSAAIGPGDRVYVIRLGRISILDEQGLEVAQFGQAIASHLLIDEQGSIYAFSVMPSAGIAKFHPDGSPSLEFGANGHGALGTRPDSTFLTTDLVRASDGSLYLVGTRSFSFSTARYGALAKFDSAGKLVTGYGNDGGILNLDMPGGRISTAHAAAVDAHGNVYVSGWAVHSDAQDYTLYVAKINSGGGLVREFGSDGVWFSPHCQSSLTGPSDFYLAMLPATSVAVAELGEILVGGSCDPQGSPDRPVVFRLDGRGVALDSFREGGLRLGLFGPDADPNASNVTSLVVTPSGIIYAAGAKRSSSHPCGDFAIAKLTAAGEHVADFGVGGVATLDHLGDYSAQIVLDSRDRLYLSGQSIVNCPTGRPVGVAPSLFRFSG